ncbi:MAG: DEAD/DEAH box helicase [Thermodesulfobacteriota bacterium]|nr:DEAD/DEAH box helicase [Thermodesulfobacteriota bacterium]
MKNRYHSNKNKFKKFRTEKKISFMKPGADDALKNIFKRIGVPEQKKFSPDKFQTDALKAINDSDCLVTAPTGSGKTWIAENAAKSFLHEKKRIWYGTPLKALTNTIYAQFAKTFGRENVGILTGDIKENSNAAIIIGTTEILRNQLYDAMHTGEDLECSLVILDEAHYLGDRERGVVWEEILIYLPVRIPVLLLSATIGNAGHIAGWLESIRGKRCHIIEETKRPVPLFPLFFHPSGTLLPFLKNTKPNSKPALHNKVIKFIKTKNPPRIAPAGKLPRFSEILKVLKELDLLPAIFFLKSRADCDQAVKLCTGEIVAKDPERKSKLAARIDQLVSKSPYLAKQSQREFLKHTATGSHHSGQLPAWKVIVETLMSEGLLDAMFATSTVAAGVNFPARSVVILNSDRFNGTEFMPLTPSEFQQMTGRAGRRGMDKIGFAIALPGKFMDLPHTAKMIKALPLDVRSQIKIDFSMVLNLLLSHHPGQIRELLQKSFASYMISKGKKGHYARKNYGHDMEYLWYDFLAHLDFLQDEGFVTENGILTEDGIWASKLRIDSPLMVAQCLRQGLLPENNPALLAAIMASFVNEKEFDDESLLRGNLPKELITEFVHLRKGLKPFAKKLLKHDFEAPNLYIQPADVVFSFANNDSWENIVERSRFAEGDLARLIMRTGENLKQMAGLLNTFPKIAKNADQAIELIMKAPVVTYNN